MPRRKRNRPRRSIANYSTSSSDNSLHVHDKRQCVNSNGDQRKVDISSENRSNMSNNSINSMNNSISSQYTPLTSTPGMNYQQFQSYPPFPTQPIMTGLEPLLKELCQRMSNVETKLTKLDSIETRLNSMEAKFNEYDADILSCKSRIDKIEQSAQFLSDVHDEQVAIKAKLNSISTGIESTKNVRKEVESRLLEIESRNLQQNLLFFAIEEKARDEHIENEDGNNGKDVPENCIDTIYEFCKNNLKLENPKTKFQIEKAYRIGKQNEDPLKPRPIVVEFAKYSDREMIRNMSNRLKGSKFGISPQYPKEILERRKS